MLLNSLALWSDRMIKHFKGRVSSYSTWIVSARAYMWEEQRNFKWTLTSVIQYQFHYTQLNSKIIREPHPLPKVQIALERPTIKVL